MAGPDLEGPPVFEEVEAHERGFAAYFDRHVAPVLLALERERLDARRALWSRVAVTAIIFVAGAVVLYSLYGWRPGYLLWATPLWLLFVMLMVWHSWRPAGRYARSRKQALVPAVLRFFGEFSFDPRGRISRRMLEESQFFADWDDYAGEDLIAGTHNGRPFEFAEATLRRKREDDGGERFRGYLLALEMPQEAHGITIGLDREADRSGEIARIIHRLPGLARVPPQEGGNGAGFEVYSTHPDEAGALVSAPLMRALHEIGRLHDAHGIEFGLNNRVFLLKIPAERDLFDPARLGRTALTIGDTRRVLAEVHLVLDIVDAVARATGT